MVMNRPKDENDLCNETIMKIEKEQNSRFRSNLHVCSAAAASNHNPSICIRRTVVAKQESTLSSFQEYW